ncbi:MAG: ribonuclease Z [Candidatus Helarchaeota archaeon]
MCELSITILGSSGTIPTLYRALPATVLKRKGRIFLFDAGEGTQIQFIKSSLSMYKISDIFISHLHGDHIGGVPGILQSLSLLRRNKPLRIFGPKGIRNYLQAIYTTMNFELTFPVLVNEIETGIILDEDDFYVQCVQAEHKIEVIAYGFFEKPRPGKFYPEKAIKLGVPKYMWKMLQQKKEVKINNKIITPKDVLGPDRPGRSIVYAVDTRPSNNILKLAENIDLLIHDGMFTESLKEKAIEGGHSTALEAAEIAKNAKVKKLILTHISSRYPDVAALLKEAKEIFENVEIATDFLTIKIPYKKEILD